MPNNLARARPPEWQRGDLFPFIEECWSNSVAFVALNNVVAARLTAIDEIFFAVHDGFKPSSETELVPILLFFRSFSAFRSSVMVGLSQPADSFPLQRSCLEYAGYAKLVFDHPELAKLWLQRDQNLAGVRRKFSNRAVREAIEKGDAPLVAIYQDLYEKSIDFGAHPNEKGVLGSVVPGSLNTGNMQVMMLAGDSLQLQHGLKSCAQAGICSLKIFNLVFPAHFAKSNFDTRIAAAQLPF
ncbi:hypothetical protein CV770_02405 [Bradyrhizobium sp. AC87j1]|uniref:hypothetical protein n=1 Tax=Bradyrhizobium sp. AC87j1 TaxID=2055894 RepID=UPI000CEBBA82|nr:hypothetical protein [Bradyrhizobium sp. AC87j1]PPQ21107.1 hypothetical protein CV770_02405 [Bradyrhizobium sp. AC87j1]